MAMSCKVLLGFVLLAGLCSSVTAVARLSSRYRTTVAAGKKVRSLDNGEILQQTHSTDRAKS